jgi:hydroxyacylglutathione hydrolase
MAALAPSLAVTPPPTARGLSATTDAGQGEQSRRPSTPVSYTTGQHTGSSAGGIPLQLSDGVAGYLVDSVAECAQRSIELLTGPTAGTRTPTHDDALTVWATWENGAEDDPTRPHLGEQRKGAVRARWFGLAGAVMRMLFQQFYLESLGHASYLLADERTGRALVFDPRRDVEVYLEAARAHGVRIAFACDSHGHNDYLSGLSELAARVPEVEIWGSAAGRLGYAHRPLQDGETIEFGDVEVQVLHTPGHTPEHISLLVFDRVVSVDTPALLLSGGALLVGDLARPDLLGSTERARRDARVFCETIQTKLLPLPDYVEVFPTHVAGSLCGGHIGSRLSTTVGYERRANAILAEVSSKEEFVTECIRLDNLPAVPPYWRRMRPRNLAGVPPLGVLTEPPALTVERFRRHQAAGSIVLDTREPEAFGGGHVPGALNVGLGPAFATWAGTVLPAEAGILLVFDRPVDLWEASWQLLRIGYPTPMGWLAGGMGSWRTAAQPVHTTEQITVHTLKDKLDAGEVNLLDVRQPAEWAQGHADAAFFITGAELPQRLSDVPGDKPLAVTCGSGYRSSVAASLLARERTLCVVNVAGGMTAWQQAGYPLTTAAA